MRRLGCYSIALTALVASYGPVIAKAQTSVAVSSTPSTAATCATGSVNYVTHKLPQQCLKTGWTSPSYSTRSDGEPSNATSNPASSSQPQQTSSGSVAAASSSDEGSATLANSTLVEATTRAPQIDPSIVIPSESSSTTVPDSAPAESESESPLDNAKFLSFEDWKRQNLGAAGQSPEALARIKEHVPRDRQHPDHIALDTLGDDAEINLDFAGFGDAVRSAPPPQNAHTVDQRLPNDEHNVETSGHSPARSKDAGKTCKERTNYASFDCAANVLKTNPKCKSSSSVLVENKDSYMLNECVTDNKFIIVELCNDIQIDTVVLANFEFFSSMFRTFRVSVSDRYPVKLDKWKILGTYEARNTREIQAFLVENPLIWARYLRIEFLTHYGNEFYCPLSLLRVHGTTMMEDYRRSQDLARGDVDGGDEETELAPLGTNEVAQVNMIPPIELKTESLVHSDVTVTTVTGSTASPASTNSPASSPKAAPTLLKSVCASTSDLIDAFKPRNPATSTCSSVHSSEATETSSTAHATIASSPSAQAQSVTSTASTPLKPSTAETAESTAPNNSTLQTANTTVSGTADLSATVQSSSGSVSSPSISSSSTPSSIAMVTSIPSSASISSAPSSTASSSSQPSAAFTPIPQASQPPTQESFFKSVNKRLTTLESNATLSLQYIESQSQLLRDAFAAVEKRQLSKTAAFLASLNSTVLAELANARSDFDQLWQSTVLELAGQREAAAREREILGERIARLAEEVVGQKRLAAAQATLLLLCLGLVVFGRSSFGSVGDGGDVRFFQSLMQRGRGTTRPGTGDTWMRKARRWDSPWTSPPRSDSGRTRPGTAASLGSKSDDDDDLGGIVPRTPKPEDFRPPPQQHHGTSDDAFRPSRPHDGYAMQRQDSTTTDQDYHDSQESFLSVADARLQPHGSRRASSIRATQSAPSTPRVATPPPPSASPLSRESTDDDLHNGTSHAE